MSLVHYTLEEDFRLSHLSVGSWYARVSCWHIDCMPTIFCLKIQSCVTKQLKLNGWRLGIYKGKVTAGESKLQASLPTGFK
mmetsp:Transcript_508/g.689  ORF Transcript_508/g.689 Transcript_508/m.689 type:complete len:81 (+) Transcript_508:44-286(+)